MTLKQQSVLSTIAGTQPTWRGEGIRCSTKMRMEQGMQNIVTHSSITHCLPTSVSLIWTCCEIVESEEGDETSSEVERHCLLCAFYLFWLRISHSY